jgi:nucleotide-binding universal stress UspA family protein
MSYEALMVQLELGRSNAAQLSVAREIARRTGAVASGIAAARPIPVAAGDGFYADDVVREDREQIEADAQVAEKEFLTAMAGCVDHPDWSCGVVLGDLSDHIAEASAATDLLVVGLAGDGERNVGPNRRVDVGDLVMRAGRPVLAVPSSVQHLALGCAVVAWKNGREARRAVMDALPILRQMERVVLIEVAPASEADAAKAGLKKVAAWLELHGIAPTSRFVAATRDEGEHLLAVAEEEGASLLVAGAYGHSRLREWLVGGVTRKLLHDGRRCLMLSH